MDDIGRLLNELMAGHLTAAVPLLDLLVERGLTDEAFQFVGGIGATLDHIRVGMSEDYPNSDEIRHGLSTWVAKHFWHLLPDRTDRLKAAEAWLLSPPVVREASAEDDPDGDESPEPMRMSGRWQRRLGALGARGPREDRIG